MIFFFYPKSVRFCVITAHSCTPEKYSWKPFAMLKFRGSGLLSGHVPHPNAKSSTECARKPIRCPASGTGIGLPVTLLAPGSTSE